MPFYTKCAKIIPQSKKMEKGSSCCKQFPCGPTVYGVNTGDTPHKPGNIKTSACF